MNNVYSRNPNGQISDHDFRAITETEWLVTNGLGGYATGTVSGELTRVFHGYLIAALPSPLGRTTMLNTIVEELVFPDGHCVGLSGLAKDHNNSEVRKRAPHLTNFRLESGLPVWTYELEGVTLEKRLVMPHRQNTTYISYRLTYGDVPVKLRLRPAVNMRPHEAPVDTPIGEYRFAVQNTRYELQAQTGRIPTLRLFLSEQGNAFTIDPKYFRDVTYDIERSRGYISCGDLWSPGFFSTDVSMQGWSSLVVSTEPWEVLCALTPEQAWDAEQDRKRRLLLEAHPRACDESCRELVWAADQFLFNPVGRPEDTARARAAGDEIRTVIAGYHWFTDWGRDTMISLEGLTVTTGRLVEANYILRTFAHYIKDGLIPNMFPEGKTDGLYHTADATLWFFHAFGRYFQHSNDRHLMDFVLPKLLDIVGHHLRGTHYNIHVDPEDGLLIQGQDGYQLTWMDAKVGDWVVTPRRGKAVEINALWYNALRLLEGWLRSSRRDSDADGIAGHAAKAKQSFNQKFWNQKAGYLFDVIDGHDPEADAYCRPNQIFSLSLDYPILDESRWQQVLDVVDKRLRTPLGLRSLAPGERDYKPCYDGDLRSRDAAYHQGTVWGWLIGPFVDAWLRVHPDDHQTARNFLEGFRQHLQQACVGSISEIFDAEAPFLPRGCCAQAWSVAEVLRCFVKTSGELQQFDSQTASKPISAEAPVYAQPAR